MEGGGRVAGGPIFWDMVDFIVPDTAEGLELDNRTTGGLLTSFGKKLL